MAGTIEIPRRFNGPVDSAHGGYACGLIARHLDAPVVEVTLRAPPPLQTELELREAEPGVRLIDGETLVAEARPVGSLDLEVPAPVSLEQAEAARERSSLHEMSPYPTCFVCGPQRQPGDGLRVIAGRVEGRGEVIASPWEVGDVQPIEDGAVRAEIVWSVLDCPSGCSLMLMPEIGVAMLGRMTAEILAPVRPGETYVAVGWPFEHEGRKHRSGTALFSPDGELVAAAKGLWIELRDQS